MLSYRFLLFLIPENSSLHLPLHLIASGFVIFCVSVTHNTPEIANFLIETDVEMHRVSWPRLRYIIHSIKVIVFVVFTLAATILVIDLFWNVAFDFCGFLIA